MATRIVGVDIGSTRLRAVEVEAARKAQPVVTRFHEVALPEGSVKRGEVIEVNTVASALKRLWSDGRFTSRDVVLGMGGQSVISRDLSVPSAPLPRIRESLPFQVQDLLPVPVGDAVLDFYPVSEESGEGGPQVKGLLVAAVKQAVLTNIKAVTTAGLNPVGVDLIPFALTRALGRSLQAPELIAYVHVGANTTNVVITRGTVPQFVRIIPAGGDDVTRNIMTRLEVDHAEAEAVKVRLGLAHQVEPADHAALEVIYSTTSELITSIRNTLSYFLTANGEAQFARLVLSGGGVALAGLAPALSEVTRIPVTVADGGAGVAFAPALKDRTTAAQRDAMTVAVGLALGSAA